ncbi:DUF4249 family protein [candidate division KSB1 bacterium]|nr:DUF4249 family protein [candidate division KSB1 bacterium]
MKKALLIIFFIVLLAGCGKVPVDVGNGDYEPKIVVDAYIIAGQPLQDIRITRNFPLNQDIDLTTYYITDADASVTDVAAKKTYKLVFNPLAMSYEYPSTDMVVEYGKTYRLDVDANVAGKALSTSSTTTVPPEGFAIDQNQSGPLELKYRAKNENGDLVQSKVYFNLSPGIDSYLTAITALEASEETFIEANAFGFPKDMLSEDNHLAELSHQNMWTQTRSDAEGLAKMEIEWFTIWFYGRYRITIYAADKNFTDFALTHRMVQDMDGNLLEPKFHFEGDGTGVFGSAVADTIYVTIIK